MRIQHNIMAMNAYRNYTSNTSALAKNLEKLSSGYKINRAGDDAAGLAISEKMRAQITGLETAQKNAKDGISLIQTAEGALTEVHDMLNRMVELADQSANGTYDDATDRANLQKEVEQLKSEINRIAKATNFNGIKLLNGTMGDTTAISAALGDPNDGTELTSLMSGATAITETSAIAEQAEVQAKSSYYIGDELKASVKTGGTTASTEITLNLKVGGGGSVTVTIKLESGSSAAGSTSSISASALINGLQGLSAATSTTTIPGASDGGKVTVSLTGSIAGTTATFENLSKMYDFSFTGAGETNEKKNMLTVTARTAASAGTVVTGIKAEDLGVNSTTAKWGNTADKAALEAKLKEDLNGDATNPGANDVAIMGSQPKYTSIGESKKEASLKLGSVQINLDADKLQSGSAIKIGDKTYYLVDTSKTDDDLTDAQKAALDALKNDANAVEVKFDSTATSASNSTAINALANKIDSNSGTTGLNAMVTGGYIQIQETKAHAESVATDPTKKISFADLVKAPDMKVGTAAAKTEITIANELAEGTTVKIGNKTFQFGLSDASISPDNIFVKWAEGDAAANAAALASALKTEGYSSATATGGKIAIDTSELDLEDTAVEFATRGLTLQIGDTSDNYNKLSVAIHSTDCSSLGIQDVDIGNQSGASIAVDKLKEAINQVSSVRGTLGATQNRLEHTINNLSVMTENIQDAEASIRDVDVAKEMMAYTKNNILVQSAQAMLAQANQVPQGVLQLLQ